MNYGEFICQSVSQCGKKLVMCMVAQLILLSKDTTPSSVCVDESASDPS